MGLSQQEEKCKVACLVLIGMYLGDNSCDYFLREIDVCMDIIHYQSRQKPMNYNLVLMRDASVINK